MIKLMKKDLGQKKKLHILFQLVVHITLNVFWCPKNQTKRKIFFEKTRGEHYDSKLIIRQKIRPTCSSHFFQGGDNGQEG